MNSHSKKKCFLSCSDFITKGLHLGDKYIEISHSPFWHPLMSHYFLGIQHQISVFNIQQTQKAMLRAFYIVATLSVLKGRILIINTNPEFSKICSDIVLYTQGPHRKSAFLDSKKDRWWHFQEKALISYSTWKWRGGMLTNWKQISKSVYTFGKFSQRCGVFLDKNYVNFPKYKKIQKCFQGLLSGSQKNLFLAFREKPDIVFLVNPTENKNIISEAEKMHIPVIAFTPSHTDITGVTYPIPVNISSLQSLYYCLKKITKISCMMPQLQS